ncbi:hypothetical protein FOF48_03255 [Corallococcus sp. Z5C101001]|nr:hypothetical protein FOF48_03255 [Corallococcus sp. Z5C101001]
MGWRGGWVMSLLVVGVGCGGPIPDGAEDGLVQEPTSEPGVEAQAYCAPTAANTQRVKTILPPSQIGLPRYALGPSSFVNFQGTLHFAVNYEDGRGALWRSTGTDAGTTQVRAFPATAGNFTPFLAHLTPTSTQLFFQATDTATGSELWVSDGTTAGTRLVKDLTPGPQDSTLADLSAVGNTLVFVRERPDPATSSPRFELWKSDGTSAGTQLLRDFGSNVYVSFADTKVGNARLLFVRESGGATLLWRTDGTAGGTFQLKRLDAGPYTYPSEVRSSGTLALFTLDENSTLTELWKSDGTEGGTVRLASFGPTRAVRVLGELGGFAYFTSTSYSTQYMVIYRVPLTGGNPTPVVTLPNDYATKGVALPSIDAVSIAPGGTKLYFAVNIGSEGPAPRDTQLWVTDGTAGGTTLLRRPLSLSDEYGSPLLAVADNLVYFSSDEGGKFGIEPWVSNGTPSGTYRLKNISTQGFDPSSYPREYFLLGTRVYFSAYDDTLAGQLWSATMRTGCVRAKDAH